MVFSYTMYNFPTFTLLLFKQHINLKSASWGNWVTGAETCRDLKVPVSFNSIVGGHWGGWKVEGLTVVQAGRKTQERAWKLVLMGGFLALIGGLSVKEKTQLWMLRRAPARPPYDALTNDFAGLVRAVMSSGGGWSFLMFEHIPAM